MENNAYSQHTGLTLVTPSPTDSTWNGKLDRPKFNRYNLYAQLRHPHVLRCKEIYPLIKIRLWFCNNLGQQSIPRNPGPTACMHRYGRHLCINSTRSDEFRWREHNVEAYQCTESGSGPHEQPVVELPPLQSSISRLQPMQRLPCIWWSLQRCRTFWKIAIGRRWW